MNILNIVLSVFVNTIGVIVTLPNFIKKKLTLKIFLTYFFIMFPFFLLINMYISGISKLLLIIMLNTIALYFSLFNKNITKSLYYAIVYEILAFIMEIVMSIVFVLALNLNLDSYNSFSLSMLIFTIINSVSVYFISKIKLVVKIVNKLDKNINKNHIEMVYVIVIYIFMSLLLVFNGFNLEKDLSFVINIGMVIFVSITSIYMIYRNLKINNLEDRYDEMMEYVCKYEKIINDQGKKNHEYNNQLMVIKGYVNNKKKLEEYLNLIIDEHKGGQNYTIRELSYFPDGGIKGLIYHKLSKMEDNDIKCYLFIDKNTKNIFEDKFDIKTYQDITKLLGVFLDNAIEATLDSKDKEIELEVKNDDDSSIITISNTFNDSIDMKQIGKKGFTTKGKGHGYGLSIVKDISKNNENIDTFSSVEEDKFKQTIIVYYKEK